MPSVQYIAIVDHGIGGVIELRIQLAVGIAGDLDREVAQSGDTVVTCGSRRRGDIGVAGAVDHDVRQGDPATERRGYDHTRDLVALRHGAAYEAAEPDFGVDLQQLSPEPLRLRDRPPVLRVYVDGVANLGGEARAKSVPIPGDQPSGTDPSQFVLVLDDQGSRAGPGGAQCSRAARGAAAHDHHIPSAQNGEIVACQIKLRAITVTETGRHFRSDPVHGSGSGHAVVEI